MKKVLFWLTLYIALLGGSFMLYHLLLPIRVSFHVVASLALIAYLYQRGLPDSPLTIGALLMGIAVVVSIPFAIDPRMAFENSWSWMVNLLILLCLIQLCRDGYSPTLFKAHFVAGGLVAAIALIAFVLTGNRPGSLFDNINLTGAYCAALVIPAYNAAREQTRSRRWLYYILIIALSLTVLVTDSRGGLLSIGLAALVYVTLVWRKAFILKLALWFGAGALISASLLFISTRPNHANGDSVRLDLWRAAGDMVESHTFGVGAGLFAQEYRLIGTSGENRFTGAHNHYLTLGAELGATGLGAGAALLLLALYIIIALPLNHSQIASLAALTGIATQMLFDNYPSVNWALLVGLLTAHVVYEAELIPRGRALQLASALVALVLTVWTIRMFQFDHAQELYESALRSGRYYDAQEAVTLDPDNKLYQLELARLGGKKDSQLDPMYALTMYGRMFK